MTAATADADKGGRPDTGSGAMAAIVRLLAKTTGTTTLPALRVGSDVCDIAKLRHQLSTPAAGRFLAATFTQDELSYCAGRAERLAARWAAKEAVAKAVGSGFRDLRPLQIEVAREPNGRPYIRASDQRPWPENAHDWDWSVSLAHESDIAIAVAIAIVRGPSTEPS